jgi:hypothetical protein
MKSLLSENMLRFGTKNLSGEAQRNLTLESIMQTINENGLHGAVKARLRLNEAEMAKHADFTNAAVAWKKLHKGNFNNVKGTTLTFAGTKYFVCYNAPANPAGGAIMQTVSANCLEIRPNRNGVPMPYWAGSVWINQNGTATTTNSSAAEPPIGSVFYPDVTAGFQNLPADLGTILNQYGAVGTNWTTYCTNIAPTVTAMNSVKNSVTANQDKYKTQPTGVASNLWLTIKPLVGA